MAQNWQVYAEFFGKVIDGWTETTRQIKPNGAKILEGGFAVGFISPSVNLGAEPRALLGQITGVREPSSVMHFFCQSGVLDRESNPRLLPVIEIALRIDM